MLRKKFKRKNLENESTNARHKGGITRSSDEVSVMEMERRGNINQLIENRQPKRKDLMKEAKSYKISKHVVWEPTNMLKQTKEPQE